MLEIAQQALEKYPEIKKNWLPIALGILGLIFFAYGLISLFLSSSNKNTVVFQNANSATVSPNENPLNSKIKVDIEGAVANPGVYELKNESIIQDALVAAGGFTADADREKVAKTLNLALKLVDGSKIYIPKIGEMDVSTVTAGENSQTQIISVNNASSDQLDSLPGIGPVTAQKIINLRPYSSLQDLVSKKAVSQKVFDNIKDKISL